MKTLKDYSIKELTTKVYDFITRANIEIDGKLDGKTIAGQSKFFAKDLQIKNSFKNLYLYQIRDAFYEGVRDEQEEHMYAIHGVENLHDDDKNKY